VSLPDSDPPPSQPPGIEAVLIGVVGLALAAGLAWWASSGPRRGGSRDPATKDGTSVGTTLPARYAGSSSCEECHPGETAHYLRSGHARTLRPAGSTAMARRLDGQTVADPEDPDVSWSYALRDGQFTVERTEGGSSETMAVEYALGSGQHAMTFVSLVDRDPGHPAGREHRLTYFAPARKLDITPGQKAGSGEPGVTPLGRDLNEFETRKCFDCHTTRTSSRGPAVLDESTMIPDVTCERCHGPAQDHVEAARRGKDDLGMPFGTSRPDAQAQVRMCGACHRLPEMAPASQIRPGNPILARFQPLSLMQSKCYKQSRGRLSCTTCHDPHARTSTDRLAYEAACLNCHRPPSQTPCSVSPRSDCLDCHMPRVEAARNLLFSDHWIRVPGR
jgi:hypothetical protein